MSFNSSATRFERRIKAVFSLDDLSPPQVVRAINAFNRLGETCHLGKLISAEWDVSDSPADGALEEIQSDVPDGFSELVIQAPSDLMRLLGFLASEEDQDLDEFILDSIKFYAEARCNDLVNISEDQG